MRNSKLLIAALGALLFSFSSAVAAERLSTILPGCENCHGVGGNSMTPGTPRLNGQKLGYLENRLRDLSNPVTQTERAFHVMGDIASVITPEDIEGLARYFADQKPMSAKNRGALAKTGAHVYLGYTLGNTNCASCHGLGGEGRGEVPRLIGQDATYLSSQLTAYVRATRVHAGMNEKAWSLGDKEIKAIVAYLGRAK